MNKDLSYIFITIAAIALLAGKKIITMAGKDAIIAGLKSFLPSVEGFSVHPYWDVSRYSWGYGTPAPGPTGTITRDQAADEMITHALSDYTRLYGVITQPLSVNQWVALLSFAYNLGAGNGGAMDLVPYINAGDWNALGEKWSHYVHAGGQVIQALVDRRQREWDLWLTE